MKNSRIYRQIVGLIGSFLKKTELRRWFWLPWFFLAGAVVTRGVYYLVWDSGSLVVLLATAAWLAVSLFVEQRLLSIGMVTVAYEDRDDRDRSGEPANRGRQNVMAPCLLLIDGQMCPVEDAPCQFRYHFTRRCIYPVYLCDGDGGIVARGELNLVDGGRDEVLLEIPAKQGD